MKLRLGTRGSRLATTQSGWVARRLEALGHEVELVIVETEGDLRTDVAFGQIGAPGVFVRELERALAGGRVDLAVHSFKDLPSAGPDELCVPVVPGREDPRDVLFVRPDAHDPDAGELPLRRDATVGTASARRAALLADLRPDLATALLRGNVPTRLEKIAAGEADATLLAAAGVARLEEAGGAPLPGAELVRVPLDPAVFVPAPSQGALAVQVRADDEATGLAVAPLDDDEAHRCVAAERALLARVQGGCDLPFGAHGVREGGGLVLRAALGTDDGLVRVESRGDDPDELASEAWAMLEART